MRVIIIASFLAANLFANIFAGSGVKHSMEIKGDFAKTRQCIRCHLTIYKEYKASAHYNSIPERDPIHARVVELYQKAHGTTAYPCAKCHAPAVKDRKNPAADPYYHEAIACAYCHRIEAIEEHPKANKNVISPKKGLYFGVRHPEMRSDYHKIDLSNPIHKNGDVCMGCHSHKQNSGGFVVCETESNNTLAQNCITCHMPQVEGSLSDRVDTPAHAYHGFATIDRGREYLQKYVDLNLTRNNGRLQVAITNRAPHKLLLHPLRMARLVVTFYKGGKVVEQKSFDFERLIGKEGRPTPPWLADQVVKDTMIKGGERRLIEVELPEADRVEAQLLLFRVHPKIAKKMGLESKPVIFKSGSLAL
jgi:hypothetical protein